MGSPRLNPDGWVALLRAINVGGRNVVPMAALRTLFEAHGAAAVSTYIQSGNVVFTHPERDGAKLGAKLEAAVAGAFGVESRIVLRTFAELAAVAQATPFGPDNAKTHVVFLEREPAAAAVQELAALDLAPDRAAVIGSELYLSYPNGVSGARRSGAQLERILGVAGTARNWNTVTRLADMAAAASR